MRVCLCVCMLYLYAFSLLFPPTTFPPRFTSFLLFLLFPPTIFPPRFISFLLSLLFATPLLFLLVLPPSLYSNLTSSLEGPKPCISTTFLPTVKCDCLPPRQLPTDRNPP
eukprot:TRINITY_DN4254_c0_g1_i6.p1 TRINITY_DN4254_c0_g1~~TRINITY_DN4254_c0_g1_i6.p1  ORF type:complete len:110 (-),score=8.13 TRINITY_DN4254_c0_g1_i6:32-361(-)